MGEGHLRQRDQVHKAVPVEMTETRGWIRRSKGDSQKAMKGFKSQAKEPESIL